MTSKPNKRPKLNERRLGLSCDRRVMELEGTYLFTHQYRRESKDVVLDQGFRQLHPKATKWSFAHASQNMLSRLEKRPGH